MPIFPAVKFVIADIYGRKRMELDMLGVPRVGDSIDIFEFLPVNERHKYRHAKVVDCWWEPDRSRTLCPRLVVEYGPLPERPKEGFPKPAPPKTASKRENTKPKRATPKPPE